MEFLQYINVLKRQHKGVETLSLNSRCFRKTWTQMFKAMKMFPTIAITARKLSSIMLHDDINWNSSPQFQGRSLWQNIHLRQSSTKCAENNHPPKWNSYIYGNDDLSSTRKTFFTEQKRYSLWMISQGLFIYRGISRCLWMFQVCVCVYVFIYIYIYIYI